MNEIFLEVEITRNPVVTTLKNTRYNREESVVMFVGKITAPAKEVTGKNQVFFYTKDMFYYSETWNVLSSIFSAIATSKAGDKVVLKTIVTQEYLEDRLITGCIRDSMFYNKTTQLGDKITANVDV